MGHMTMLYLNWRRFSLLKFLFEINLNHMTITCSFPFGLTGSTIATVASAAAISKERSNLQWNCPWLLGEKNHRASWYSWFFCQKLAFGLLREFLYVEFLYVALTQRNLRHTWCEGVKCYGNRNEHSYPLLTNIDFAIVNKTQTQQTKHSVTGNFLF